MLLLIATLSLAQPADRPKLIDLDALTLADARKLDGFVNVDSAPHCSPDLLHDLEAVPWPFETSSADEIVVFRPVMMSEGFGNLISAEPSSFESMEMPLAKSTEKLRPPATVSSSRSLRVSNAFVM